ncbi:dihydrofolate reductase [Modestobacter sp. I12A-02628]|uniref:Dihydrofolate reductase n=1 Tax=Goekera deserti TaxID=2497753 RepID=A0A7K3WDY3_9ACTN|nr:dihydrofolate reductase family protein [Goekera deserti]MPQ99610.1 dihydrofolate reductase [Goekera deserti]NDI46380.1 dihydrofolate reductase [Goekera deserti]NEL54688.1 dihydrofolate reductase [Goekera deserti]
MRTLIVSEFVTLDGVVEAPGGEPTHPHTGWAGPHVSGELFQYKLEEVLDAGSLLLGRTTYESFAGAWPAREGEFADRINGMPKHVVTSRPGLRWQATAIGGDVPAAVREIKAGDGDPVLVNGSATLVRTLLAHDLVDELRLMVFPVAVGGGLRLFGEERHRTDVELTELTRYPSGVTLQVYRVVLPEG